MIISDCSYIWFSRLQFMRQPGGLSDIYIAWCYSGIIFWNILCSLYFSFIGFHGIKYNLPVSAKTSPEFLIIAEHVEKEKTSLTFSSCQWMELKSFTEHSLCSRKNCLGEFLACQYVGLTNTKITRVIIKRMKDSVLIRLPLKCLCKQKKNVEKQIHR